MKGEDENETDLPVVMFGPSSRVWFDEEIGMPRVENVVVFRGGSTLVKIFKHQANFDRVRDAIERESQSPTTTGETKR